MTTETKVDASKLLADFDSHPGHIAAAEHPFWMGLSVDCPVNQIDVAGLHFPKTEEELILNHAGEQVRVPVFGALHTGVTRENFEALVERLPRLVIRFTGKDLTPVVEDGSGQNTGDPIRRARKGFVIKIPTEAQVAEAKAETPPRNVPRYTKQPGDRSAAEFMYFKQGKREREAPATIAEAGLVWPEELAEIDDLLS